MQPLVTAPSGLFPPLSTMMRAGTMASVLAGPRVLRTAAAAAAGVDPFAAEDVGKKRLTQSQTNLSKKDLYIIMILSMMS